MYNVTKVLIVSILLVSCVSRKKLETAREMSVDICLPTDYKAPETITLPDTLARYTDNEGCQHTIGRNTLDEKTGEQLLTVDLQEVKVTARFKNVAERRGFVQVAFNMQIPPELQNSNWELYLLPQANSGLDVMLPGVSLYGENFKKKQDRQYEYYNELCKVILPENDLNQFLNRRELEKSIACHNRKVLREAKLSYRRSLKSENFRIQSSQDTAVFVSRFMNSVKVNRNEYFKRVLAEQFDRIVTLKRRDNMQADMMAMPDSIFNYTYETEIPASEATGRITIAMKAEIRTLNGDRYPVKMSDSLSFVVSSLRNFIKEKPMMNQDYNQALISLKKGEYRNATDILRPYADENTVIAYLALGYDKMAYNILSHLPETADNLYLQSIAAFRLKKEEEAVHLYIRSCDIDQSKRWRGNLDPEISQLIRKYGLNED